jgi:hypothetical protein
MWKKSVVVMSDNNQDERLLLTEIIRINRLLFFFLW